MVYIMSKEPIFWCCNKEEIKPLFDDIEEGDYKEPLKD